MFNEDVGAGDIGQTPYPGAERIRVKSLEDQQCAEYLQGVASPRSLLDVGCHDGHFLWLMREAGWSVRGCEPSNYAAYARDAYGLEVDQGLFAARLYEGRVFDAVSVRNVLCVAPDPPALLNDCFEVLRPGGLLLVENINPETWYSLETISFGHEVQYYFDIEHIEHLAARSGFSLAESRMGRRMLGLFRKGKAQRDQHPTVLGLANRAETRPDYAAEYRTKLARTVTVLKSLFADWRRSGQSVCVYGAGVHTQFMLSAVELEDADIACVVDSDPMKHGKLLAGTTIKIKPPQAMAQMKIDVVLVSSGPYQEEIISLVRAMDLGCDLVKIHPEPGFVQRARPRP
jgi:SAM-dependent methyltransferase